MTDWNQAGWPYFYLLVWKSGGWVMTRHNTFCWSDCAFQEGSSCFKICSPSSQDIRKLTSSSDQFVSPILTLHILQTAHCWSGPDSPRWHFSFAMQRSPALSILPLSPHAAGGTVLGCKYCCFWEPDTCFVVCFLRRRSWRVILGPSSGQTWGFHCNQGRSLRILYLQETGGTSWQHPCLFFVLALLHKDSGTSLSWKSHTMPDPGGRSSLIPCSTVLFAQLQMAHTEQMACCL